MQLKNNDLVEGSSGKFGKKLVYRQRGDKTILARQPEKTWKPATARQQEIKESFYEGVLYAKSVIADPILKEIYQKKATRHKSAYNIAVSDFCKAPEIRKYDTSGYTGQSGDRIVIRAVDDFKVVDVSVTIKDCSGNVIESGAATESANGADWIYTATVTTASTAPACKMVITASDMPGNVTKQEVTLQ